MDNHTSKETFMKLIRNIPRLTKFLAAFGCAMLGLVVSAPSAFALRTVSNLGGPAGVAPSGSRPTLTHTVVANGMPGWQITVLVAGVAILAGAIAIFLVRGRAAHRTVSVSAA
jgi:hypothetical protein